MSFAKITPIQEKALAKINMSAQDVRDSLGTHGLQTTLISLADKFKKSGVDLSKFFTKSNALKGVLGVLGNQTETYVEILEDLEQKQGFVDSAFDRTSKTAGFQLNQAFASLKTAGIELGDTLAPMIKSIANSVVELARTYRGLTTGQKETITTTLKWVAALGPATMLIGSMANGIRVLIPLFIKIGKIVAANPIAAMATVAAFAIFKLTKALFENATVTERIAKKSAQIDLRVKQAANEATSEQIRLINKQLLIARDAEASDVDRASAIKFLNKEVRSLNGQLSLENIHTQNTTDSIKKHTQAVIENAKAQALKDELAEASRELSKIEEQWNTNMAAKLKTAAAAKDKSVMDSEVISWATTQMKSQTKERDALRKLVNSIAKKITKAEIKAAPLTKAKTFDEIQVTKYANSINGLNQKLADLNVLYQDLEPTSKDYNKVASEITSTQGMLNKKYQKTTGSVGELTGVTSDLNGVLSEEKQKLNDLIEAGASQEELEAQATKVKEAIDKVNKNLQKYNELVPDKTEASEGFSALKDAVADAEIALQTAIASGGDYAVQLQDFITATDKLKKAQDEYNDAVGDTTEDKIPAWIKLIDMFQPKLKIFGKSLSEIFEESGEAIADALDTALNAFDAYQNRMTTVANNEKKKR